MRKRNLLSRFAFTAIVTGSITIAGQIQAANDFDALLADVDFGGAAAAIEEAVEPAIPEGIGLPVEATELASTPAAEALVTPQESSEPLPPPPALEPVADGVAPQAPVEHQAACSSCSQSCSQECGSNCGHKCGFKGRQWIQDGFCQPYTPPRLPTSTFYQYWRSNACNVNVWDGFKNRCHPHIDVSIHKKQMCGCGHGCAGGACHAAAASGDCGPAPAEWYGQAACDGCDAR